MIGVSKFGLVPGVLVERQRDYVLTLPGKTKALKTSALKLIIVVHIHTRIKSTGESPRPHRQQRYWGEIKNIQQIQMRTKTNLALKASVSAASALELTLPP